jgi:stage IV sporulation protein FB
MLSMPEPTAYDLRFRVLGFPVRVHPGFWIVMAILGGVGSSGVRVTSALIFIACAFVSILVHELGHATTQRAFGQWPRIVLYWMGGLAIPSEDEPRPARKLLISLAGPAAGFALLLLTLAGAAVAYGLTPHDLATLCGAFLGLRLSGSDAGAGLVRLFVEPSLLHMIVLDLIQINLIWTLFNLLPIFPLDGGQALGAGLRIVNPANGQRWMHTVSLVVAGLLALLALRGGFEGESTIFRVVFMGALAFQNYQILQMMHHARRGGFGDDADDWWRR